MRQQFNSKTEQNVQFCTLSVLLIMERFYYNSGIESFEYSGLVPLIQSLTMSEKRYFAVYENAISSQKPKQYLGLFNLLVAQPGITDEVLSVKLGLKNDVQLRKAKSYLYQSLLKSLRHFRQVSPRVQVYEYIINAEILFLKGFLQMALKELNKAEKVCDYYEFLEEKIPVLEWKSKVLINLNAFDKQRQNAQKEELLIRTIENLKLFNRFHENVIATFRKTGWPANDVQQSVYKKIYDQAKQLKKPESYRAKVIQLTIFTFLDRLTVRQESDPSVRRELIELLETNPGIAISTPSYVLPAFNHVLQHLIETENLEAFGECILALEKLEFLSPSGNRHALELSLLLQIQFYLRFNLMAEIAKKEPQFSKCLEGVTGKSYNIRQAEIALLFAYYHLLGGRAQQALQVMLSLIHYPLPEGSGELKSLVRILEIMIHFDLGNVDLIESKLLNAKRYLKRHNQLYGFEMLLLSALHKILQSETEGQKLKLFAQLHVKLRLQLDNNALTTQFRFFNLLQWVALKSVQA